MELCCIVNIGSWGQGQHLSEYVQHKVTCSMTSEGHGTVLAVPVRVHAACSLQVGAIVLSCQSTCSMQSLVGAIVLSWPHLSEYMQHDK